MLNIVSVELGGLERASLNNFVHSTVSALADVAHQQGQKDPEVIAAAWLESAVRIAMRHRIEEGQEIAVLALLVADLGGDFDLNPENAVLVNMLDQDSLEGASSAAAMVAARPMSFGA